ncbi:hypothetical protein R1flu_017673 [Riccia fluitans]|uniref:Methylthioribose-1-phosphate isomerase n=1 Tax=Riccia fluitans TaxID=41844 RepID=A0ABD1ZDM1_9MARC
MGEEKTLEAIRYKRGSLQLLDQRKLPHESVYINIPDCDVAWNAIKDMVVRGAPAIAVTAALALAVELVHLENSYSGDPQDAAAFIEKRLSFLVSSRPTAVNLSDAAYKLQRLTSQASINNGATAKTVFAHLIEAAEEMLKEDVLSNKAIGEYGAKAILQAVGGKEKLRILTHCNTGSLATAGYGTALGVIRSLFAQGQIETAYCTETRPYNQGSRLTAYELVHDGIPSVLIADSAVAYLMASGRVDAVVVGADRITANGDTANKIGTLNVAVAAHQFGVPFFVAAPLTTVDIQINSGDEIVIEERSKTELTHAFGAGPEVAAPGIGVWNPAFDVTPAKYITGVITDRGVVWRDEKAHGLDIGGFALGTVKYEDHEEAGFGDLETTTVTKEEELKLPNGVAEHDSQHTRHYHKLDEKAASEYMKNVPVLAEKLGGSPDDWEIQEVGDGNMNYVYIVEGPRGSLVLKQALPYVRCVGESWAMTLERAYFEAKALRKEFELAPEYVPEVYYFDHPMAIIAMRYLEPPHIILRKGLIAGTVYPRLAEHISDFMSKTLFHTSLLALDTHRHKEASAQSYANVEMCRLSEQVIFTEPYMEAANNRWTSPQLDPDVRALREDIELKVEVAELKARFCERTQALLHGDLHTGSVMVTETSTKVIDPEFSFYGPMAFDVGAFVANMFLAFFSQDGHAGMQGARDDYKKWILQTVSDVWSLFAAKFKGEWDKSWDSPGDAYLPAVYNTPAARTLSEMRFIEDVFVDMLGFAACKMIRRIVGIAHVEDMDSIADADKRAACERKALTCAKVIMKQRRKFSSITQVIDLVRHQ